MPECATGDDQRTADARRRSRRSPAPLLVLLIRRNLLFAASPAAAPSPPRQPSSSAAVQDLFTRPDETSSVDDQVILGERVEILEDTAGFARVRTAAGEIAWIPERALRRGEAAAPADAKIARVTSNFAHVYATPSFTKQKPLLTAPVGATMVLRDFLEGEERRRRRVDSWVRVACRMGASDSSRAATLPSSLSKKISLFLFVLPPTGSPSASASSARRTRGAARRLSGSTARGSCRGSSASTACF